MNELFAFGDWVVDGESCPMDATGRNPGSGPLPIVDQYDNIVKGRVIQGEIQPMVFYEGFKDGLISEDDARSAWLEAMNRTESDLGRRIARELGWLPE